MKSIATSLFASFFREKRADFEWLRPLLLASRLHVSLEEYLSLAMLYSFIASVFIAGIFFLAARLLFGYFLVWDIVTRIPAIQWIDAARLFAEILLVIFFLLISFFVMLLLFISYLNMVAWERQRKISGYLPYAIGWMAAMASVGVIPFIIFKKLAEAEEYYHEVSQEAQYIVRDVELLGFDLIAALRNVVDITPSHPLRVFLQGAITASLSGGEMGDYFISKARETMEGNRKRLQEFTNTLGMIAEVYVVALVAGPLFIIILFAAMMMMSGASPAILQAIVYMAMPTGSVLFIFLIDALTPSGL